MPIYEYHCRSCAHEFEKLVALSNTAPIACPACASTEVTKKISRVASGKTGCDGCSSTSCSSGCSCHH